MFIMVAMDRNNETMSIAFCLVVANNVKFYMWFLMRLKEDLRDTREVLFITNIDDVITFSIGQAFRDSYHGFCCKNLVLHVRTRVSRNKTLELLLWHMKIIYFI